MKLISIKNTIISYSLSYVYRSAKFFNYLARLFIFFYRSPMYETFRTESKINNRAKKLKDFADR